MILQILLVLRLVLPNSSSDNRAYLRHPKILTLVLGIMRLVKLLLKQRHRSETEFLFQPLQWFTFFFWLPLEMSNLGP